MHNLSIKNHSYPYKEKTAIVHQKEAIPQPKKHKLLKLNK
jgi:hypothetical protein